MLQNLQTLNSIHYVPLGVVREKISHWNYLRNLSNLSIYNNKVDLNTPQVATSVLVSRFSTHVVHKTILKFFFIKVSLFCYVYGFNFVCV